jgi:hypothetical protein
MESTSTADPTANPPSGVNEELSPLEQDVLDEYERLAENMKKVPATQPSQKNPPTTTGIAIAMNPILIQRNSADILRTARGIARQYGRTPNGRSARWIETVRTEDELGVYAAEG